MARPNILLAISDDQSWRHAGAYGMSSVQTPAFDRVAAEGVLFNHAYCTAPQCSPSRASLLTGRNIWELEEAGTHDSLFPVKFQSYPDLLEAVGYHVGYTGKPWAPGNWRAGGCRRNPAGVEYNRHRLTPPTSGISPCDYATNFQQFLAERPNGAPFCFWFGCREPHRPYEAGSGVRAGKPINECNVPAFLPDHELVRRDLLAYELEIEWFDEQLVRMIAHLDQLGELGNTYGKRDGEELFLVEEDLACQRDLSAVPELADRRRELRARLEAILRQQNDPRVLGYGDVFDAYPHYAPKQPSVHGFKADGMYNETYWQEAESQAGHALPRNIPIRSEGT